MSSTLIPTQGPTAYTRFALDVEGLKTLAASLARMDLGWPIRGGVMRSKERAQTACADTSAGPTGGRVTRRDIRGSWHPVRWQQLLP
jgi:hypothetical protein